MLAIRQRNAAQLSQGLADLEGVRPQMITCDAEHAYHQYGVVVDQEVFGCDRDVLTERLKARGIATGVHYPRGLHQQPIYENLYSKCSLPNTEYLAEHILALPVHHGLTLDQVSRIVEAVWACRG